jgi:hypothetical protein
MWLPVADLLLGDGHDVLVPDLRPARDRAASWRDQVAAAVDAATGFGERPLSLVAHSGAGPLLPAIGAALSGRAASYGFVDAALPHPGKSRLEALPPSFAARVESLEDGGFLPPWPEWFGPEAIEGLIPDTRTRERFLAEIEGLPITWFRESLPVVEAWPDAPCFFLCLSPAYEGEAAEAEAMGWPTRRLDAHHLSMVTDPRPTARAILALGSLDPQ